MYSHDSLLCETLRAIHDTRERILRCAEAVATTRGVFLHSAKHIYQSVELLEGRNGVDGAPFDWFRPVRVMGAP